MNRLLISIGLGATLVLGAAVESADAYGAAFYGTQRRLSARSYSGVYAPPRARSVRTFSLPVYGGGYYAPGFRRGFYPAYRQPVIIYPPAVYSGW